MHIWSILISCEKENEVQKGERTLQRIGHWVANIEDDHDADLQNWN